METLSIDGKMFVKASKVARDFGYTADYVGQLCRGNKVAARLVGRSWYVDLGSLESHLKQRYKKVEVDGNEPKKGYTVEVGITEEEGERAPAQTPTVAPLSFIQRAPKTTPPVPEPVSFVQKKFYARVPRYIKSHDYDTDDTELIPAVKKAVDVKTAALPVELADASPVAVKGISERYTFETPELPEVRFRGELKVNDLAPSKVLEIPEEPVKVAFHTRSERPEQPQLDTVATRPQLAPHKAAISEVRPHSAARLPVRLRNLGDTHFKDVHIRPMTTQESSSGHKLVAAGILAVALMIATSILTVETKVSSTAKLSVETFSVPAEALKAAIYDSIKAFLE